MKIKKNIKQWILNVLKTKFSYRVSEGSNEEDIKVKKNIVNINLTYLKNEIVIVDEKTSYIFSL